MNYIRHLNAFFSLVRNDERLACSHVSLYLALFQYWNYNRFQNPFPVYRQNLMKLSKIGSKNTYHKCLKELHSIGYVHCNPPLSRFKPVTVSVVRLDLRDEQTNQQQLDMFHPTDAEACEQTSRQINNTSLVTRNPSPAFGIQHRDSHVPQLTPAGTDFDTAAISNPVHTLKDKHFLKESSSLAPDISTRKQKAKTVPAAAAKNLNVCHPAPPAESGEPVEGSQTIPAPPLEIIQTFFTKNNYPLYEALKFFSHYQSIGWKIKGITPIINWQASAQKWMLNAGKYTTANEKATVTTTHSQAMPATVEDLYHHHLQQKNIFSKITVDHFTQLQLEITEALITEARSVRINQLMGSNSYSVNQLLQAYQSNNLNHPLCQSDQLNFLSLTKRLAVLHHFRSRQHNIIQSSPP